MKKIIIGKTETVASIIEQVMDTPDPDVILVVPRDALLKSSLNNFRTIKRETDGVQKSVAIESVDEEVLALSTAAGLTATHPLFRGSAHVSQPVIDLRGAAAANEVAAESETVREANAEVEEKGKNGGRHTSIWNMPKARSAELTVAEEEDITKPTRTGAKLRPKVLLAILIPVIILVGAAYVATAYFNRGSVSVTLHKVPWTYANQVATDKTLTKPDVSHGVIPGEIFNQTRNITQLFPASGIQTVSQKASGRITIYNAYSSEKQILVKTTRFVTEDGKVFRLSDQVLVPGAEVKDGKIIPSSTQAMVTADQPGAEYNRSKTERLNIPGFKGTPKYAGFYGEIISTAGGFVGKKPVPTDKDIADGRQKTSDILQSSLRATAISAEPHGFTILPGASEIEITKLTTGSTTDAQGNFSVFGEARFRGIGFRDAQLDDFLATIATQPTSTLPNTPLQLDDLTKTFATSTNPDFTRGAINFGVEAKGTLGPMFDEKQVRGSLAGKNMEEAKHILNALPGLTEATVSVWPFWISTMPKDAAKITIVLK